MEDLREEGAILAAERDGLAAELGRRTARLREVEALLRGREQASAEAQAWLAARSAPGSLAGRDAQGDEELQVALEEVQVIAEELGEANAALQHANEVLEQRVHQRTAALEAANADLRASEERQRLILDSAADYAILTIDEAGRITSWNAGARNVLGWDAAAAIGMPASRIFTPEDLAIGADEAEKQQALREGSAADERWHLRRDGSRFWGEGKMHPLRPGRSLPGGFLKILRDRTQQREVEQALHAALAERDLLMREVHHRVKNSLHLVQGLLTVQARALEGSEAATQLQEGAARVRMVAAIHDRLYRSAAGTLQVELHAYLSGLVEDLRAAMTATGEGRDVQLEIAAAATWPADAVPTLGLVLTELVTNALKYGAGHVTVRFRDVLGEPVTLAVEDEGRGLPASFDPSASHGLGMRLVAGLLRGEGARLWVDRSVPHTRFVAQFAPPEGRPPV
ncbi:sensor histidine kinase [Roseomonas sp. BN140053]|uniref:sensor histidine kinase n=1 Tax=Roseomonas sp. BN140053 TaxID=3391898 RepID=UPI0039EB4EFA